MFSEPEMISSLGEDSRITPLSIGNVNEQEQLEDTISDNSMSMYKGNGLE